MSYFLLVVVLIILGVFGFFVMKRLDCFLEKNKKEQLKLLETSERYLRIGVLNPYVIDNCAEVFEKYEKKFSDVEVLFYSGIEDELMKAFFAHKLDLLFLSEHSVVNAEADCCSKIVELSCASTIMSEANLTVGFIGEKQSKQKILWKQGNKNAVIVEFLNCLSRMSLSV